LTEGLEQAEPSPQPADEGGPSQIAIAIAVVAVLAILGFGGWLIIRDDDEPGRSTERAGAPTAPEDSAEQSGPATSARPTTTPPTTTTAPTVPTVSTVPPQTVPVTGPPVVVPPPLIPESTTPETVAADTTPVETVASSSTVAAGAPGRPTVDSRPEPVRLQDLVPNVAAEREVAGSPQQRQTVIEQLLAGPRHDVASRQPVAMLCATLSLDRPIRLGGRWQVDGRPLASIDPADVGPPGFGECVDADGERLPDGAYQFVAVDASGDTSAAGTFVAGADPLDQPFRNNGDGEVCAVLVGPSTATYYEAYQLDTAMASGELVTIPLASVRQDVRTIGCQGDEVLAEFSFDPTASRVQDLVP